MLLFTTFSTYEPEPDKISTGFKAECLDDETYKTVLRVVYFEPSSFRHFVTHNKERIYLEGDNLAQLKATMQQIVR